MNIDLVMEQFDSALTQQSVMSQVYSLEQAVKDWRERAGKAFANGDDASAKFYRDLAVEYEARNRKYRDKEHATAHGHLRQLIKEIREILEAQDE